MTCCVTGHRPSGFPFSERDVESHAEYKKRLRAQVESLIDQGYRHFITGMAEGADTDFALIVLDFRSRIEGITLEAAVPYPRKSDPKSLREYILSRCDKVSLISERYYNGCMQKRNCYMVDHADIVLAVWNGHEKGGTWNTIRYARQKKKTIRYLMLDDCIQKN